MTTTRIFVYGAMTEGMVHFSKIQNFVASSASAYVRGSAYRLKVGFPALSRDGEDLIPGQLLDIQGSDLLLGLLDEFYGFNRLDPEKSLYCREEVNVYLQESGESTRAFVYFLNPINYFQLYKNNKYQCR